MLLPLSPAVQLSEGRIFAQLFLGWGNQPRPEQLFCSRTCCSSTGTSWGFPAKPCFFRNSPHFDPRPVVSWDSPSVGSPGPLPGQGGRSGADTQKICEQRPGGHRNPSGLALSQPGTSSCVIHHPTQGWGCPSAGPSAATGARGSARGIRHRKRRPGQGCSYLCDGRGQQEADNH